MGAAATDWFVRGYGNLLIENPTTEAERAYNERIETLAVRLTGAGYDAIHARCTLERFEGMSQEDLRAFANGEYAAVLAGAHA